MVKMPERRTAYQSYTRAPLCVCGPALKITKHSYIHVSSYTHTCMYIIYVHIHLYLYTYISEYLHTYLCMCRSTSISISICTCTCTFTCLYMYIYIQYTYIYIYTHVCTYSCRCQTIGLFAGRGRTGNFQKHGRQSWRVSKVAVGTSSWCLWYGTRGMDPHSSPCIIPIMAPIAHSLIPYEAGRSRFVSEPASGLL